jgi:sortase B
MKISKSALIRVIRFACVAVFACALAYVAYTKYNYAVAENEYAELSEENSVVVTEQVTEETSQSLETETAYEETTISVDYNALKAKNDDYVFWLSACGDRISYPVVQTGDNDYYLHRTFSGKRAYSGCVFADCRDNVDGSFVRLYGHSMKNGTMFRKLIGYKSEDYFKNYPSFYVYTENEVQKYDIFSVMKVSADNVPVISNEADEEERQKALEQMNGSSLYSTGRTAEFDDKIISLVTCDVANDKYRVIINGKLVKE